MRTKLESLSPKDRAAFILMEVGLRGFAFVGSCNSDGCVVVRLQRIFPEHQDAVFVRDGVAATGRAIMELGVFGVVLGSGTEVLPTGRRGLIVLGSRLPAGSTQMRSLARAFAMQPSLQPLTTSRAGRWKLLANQS